MTWFPQFDLARTSRFAVLVFAWLFGGMAVGAQGPAVTEEVPARLPVATEERGVSREAVLQDRSRSALIALEDKQRLGAGDRISYRVVEDQDPAKSLTVTDAGDLDIPYLGLHPAAGRTCKELADEIRKRLEKDLYFSATVVIAVEQLNRKRTAGTVQVVGQIRNPGILEVPADGVLTVSTAILRAGGFAEFADKRRVRLVRQGAGQAPEALQGDRKAIVVNVLQIWSEGRADLDPTVEPGDQIYIPSRLINF